jgi:hypothetical protein
MIAIDFATRRRVRVNGTVSEIDAAGIVLDVEQAYGNCQQYIQRRDLTPVPSPTVTRGARWATELDAPQIELIRQADTFFLGTTAREHGNDASHRGGPVGFVRVDDNSVQWPDYPGNNMFNSLGNLSIDHSAALLFVDFADGRTLHLSGTATINWDAPSLGGDDAQYGRRVCFIPRYIVSTHVLTVRSRDTLPRRQSPPLTGGDVRGRPDLTHP